MFRQFYLLLTFSTGHISTGHAEQAGNPLLMTQAGANQQQNALQSGGNMESKELCFRIADTAFFVATTTGAVNAMYDSLPPWGALSRWRR